MSLAKSASEYQNYQPAGFKLDYGNLPTKAPSAPGFIQSRGGVKRDQK